MQTVSVQEFHRRYQDGECALLDVRMPDEIATAALPGAVCVPLHELGERWQSLDASLHWAVLCHHGVRSAYATAFLRQQGLSAFNIDGGIEAYALVVDPTIPRY